MRCPKCGYVSFEYLDSCKKCSKDLFEFKEKAKISLVEPAQLNLNKLLNAGEAEDTSGAEEGEDIEYNEETSVMEDDSMEVAPSPAEDLLSAIETSDESVLDVEGTEIEIDESGLGEASTSDETEGLDLTSDDGGIDFDLPFEEEGALDSTETSNEEAQAVDLGTESEGSLDQDMELEIDESDLGDESTAVDEVEGLDLTSDDGGIDFSLPMEDEGETDSQEEGEELDISLDMDTEDLESGEEGAEQGIELEIDGSDLGEESIAMDDTEEIDISVEEDGIDFSLPAEDKIETDSLEAGEELDISLDVDTEDLESGEESAERGIELEIDESDLGEESISVDEGEGVDTPEKDGEIDLSLPSEEGILDPLETVGESDVGLEIDTEDVESEEDDTNQDIGLEIDPSDLEDEEIDFSLPLDEDGEVDSLEVGEELGISVDVDSEETESGEGDLDENFQLEIDDSDLEDSSLTEGGAEDDLDFSLDMMETDDEQKQTGEKPDDDEEKNEDIEGEINLLLDDIDDTEPKDS